MDRQPGKGKLRWHDSNKLHGRERLWEGAEEDRDAEGAEGAEGEEGAEDMHNQTYVRDKTVDVLHSRLPPAWPHGRNACGRRRCQVSPL